MNRFFGIFCCLLLLTPSMVFAATEQQILLSADKTSISLQDSLSVTVTLKIKNTNSLDLSTIKIPGVDAFETRGSSSSFQSVFDNGEMASERQETLLLTPKKTGDFTLGPVTLTLSWVALTSNTLKIHVSESVKNTSPENTTPEPSTPTNTLGESDILDQIILFCSVILIISVGIFLFFRSHPASPKTTETDVSAPISSLAALDQIRKYLSRKYHLRTESYTTQELLEIEKNPEQKLLLQKCLQAIQLREYKKAPVSDSEILHLLEQYLSHEPRNTHS